MLRAEPAVFGPVASGPAVSRLIDTLATADKKALNAIRTARHEVRARAWSLADSRAPDTGGQVDHGPGGTGDPVAALLRPGNAGSNTVADHVTTARLALAQLP